MDRKLASIQKIEKLEGIEGADRIKKATILGWHCVVKADEFKEGDLCVYFEIDSLVPKIEPFHFLEKSGAKKMLIDGKEFEGYRLKTIRLRGQISQGLALPLSHFDDFWGEQIVETVGKKITKTKKIYPQIGDDVTELLGVYKYEPPVPAQLAGKIKGHLPVNVPKTDETRIQTIPHILEQYKDLEWYVTEKLDGSSISVYLNNDKFNERVGVCSRNLDLLEDDKNTMWKTVRKLGIIEKLEKRNESITLQGEIVGEGIQGNPLMIKGHDIFFFNAYFPHLSRYADFNEFQKIIADLGLKTVPLITNSYKLPATIDELVSLVTVKSQLNSNSWAEGYVFRPLKEVMDQKIGRVSFKVINPEFLLKNGK